MDSNLETHSEHSPQNHLDYRTSRAIVAALSDPDSCEDETPQSVPGYALVRELGRGAGGVTYLAQRDGSESRVALKLLHPRWSDERAVSRAWRELEVLQQVRLPSVPRLLDFGHTGASLFLAMEYLNGSSLEAEFAAGPPADRSQIRDRVALLERIARVTQQLHEKGVIHRDLKPSNIIIGTGGEPYIIDFGIARLDQEQSDQTVTVPGAAIGTPAYMSPEVARGEHSAVTTRSDVFALGAIGFWLLTSKTPHDLSGTTLHGAIHRVGWEDARTPRDIRPDVPASLSSILSHATESQAANRYPTAGEFADDLRAWLDDRPISVVAPSRWSRVARWIGAHPILSSTATSLVIAASILGSVAMTVVRFNASPLMLRADQYGADGVSLFSKSGDALHHWEAQERSDVVISQLVTVPKSMGGGEVAIVGMDFRDDMESLKTVRIYRLDDLSSPWWQTPVVPPEIAMPPGTEDWHTGRFPDQFNVVAASCADVFAQSAGDEIIVSAAHSPKSATCLRIYSLDGRVLYEAWHNGHLSGVLWVKSERLLIVQGVSDHASLGDMGYEGGPNVYPRVLMALRVPNIPDADPGNPPRLLDSWAQSPETDIAWTRAFLPDDAWTNFRIDGLNSRGSRLIAGELRDVRLDNAPPEQGLALQFLFTHEGKLDRAYALDTSSSHFGELHLEERFRLITPQQADEVAARHRASQPRPPGSDGPSSGLDP